MTSKLRNQLIALAQRRLEQTSSPRLIMTGFLLLSGMVAFLASAGLLWMGVQRMLLRYPLAIGCAYACFLGLLWLWLRSQRPYSDSDAAETGAAAETAAVVLGLVSLDQLPFAHSVESPPSESHAGQTNKPGDGTGIDPLGNLSFGDLDGDWVVVLLFIVAVLAALIVCIYLIVIGPALMGELLVDGMVVAALPKTIPTTGTGHWLWSAFRRTITPALILAAVFGFVGWGLEQVAPGAHTMGQVLHQTNNDRGGGGRG